MLENMEEKEEIFNPSAPKDLPTQQYLQECFECDPEVGLLYWKERPMYHFGSKKSGNSINSRHSGNLVRRIDKQGYNIATIDNGKYRVHRLIWKMFYNEEPDIIDHINGVRNDNRLCNLRSVTQKENAKNKSVINSRNTSNYEGVSLISATGKYSSYLYIDGANIRLGNYNTPEEAALVRELKAKELYGDEFYSSCGRDELLSSLIVKVEEIKKDKNNIRHQYFNNKVKPNNTSGYIGVIYLKDRNKWKAEIKKDGKKYGIPQQDTPEEAAYYRELKCIELYGEDYYNKMGRNVILEELKLKVDEIIKNR
jgi:hypothetical protein